MNSVIVTGGSRGLGLCVVRRLSAGGYRAIAIGRNMNGDLESAIAEADQRHPGSLQFVPFDLNETACIPALIKDLIKHFGPIRGLVNNAALGPHGALALMPDAQIESAVRVNTVAPLVLTKYVVRHMMASGGGRIVNVASITAFTGYRGLSVYSATKASLIGFTRSLAREAGPMGVNVNAVAPGFMDTDMTSGLSGEDREKIARRSALQRFPAIEDVTDAIEFLLGPKAASITGTVLTVDAGGTA